MWRALIGLGLVLGCGADPEPQPSPPTDQAINDLGPPGAVSMRLHTLVGTDALVQLELPEASTGPLPTTRSLTLGEWRRVRKGPTALWSHALPLHLAQSMYRERPENLVLTVGETDAAYKAGTATGRSGVETYRWEIARGRLFLRSAIPPKTIGVVLHQDQAQQVEARLNLRDAGLDKTDFIRLPVTLAQVTRTSLFLPAPASAVFRLTLPADARLRTGIGLAESDLPAPDAQAKFIVSVDGTPVFDATSSAGKPWREITVGLEKWAGQTVDLQLSTESSTERAYAAWATPTVVGAPTEAGPRRIVLIGIDTLRPDHLGINGHSRDTSPGLDAIATESVVFDRAWAPAPRTRPSFKTALTGRWPNSISDPHTMATLLSEAGFRTSGIVANIQLAPRLGFARGFEWYHYDNMTDADVQVDRALDWLDSHQTEDAALFLHLMDPHIFYDAPAPYGDMFTLGIKRGTLPDRFNRWTLKDRHRAGKLSEGQQDFIRARYDGEIAFLDAQISRLAKHIDTLPGQTLLVLISDHGEEFWEHDGFEHNHTLYEELVRTMVWIRPPGGLTGGPHRISSPVSLADVLPTILAFAKVDPPGGLDGHDLSAFIPSQDSEQRAALAQQLEARALPLGQLMFDRERWGVVAQGHKYILQTTNGEEELYDLNADPGETQNLAAERSLTPWHARLSEATGWPVAAGWRILIQDLDQVTTLEFPRPLEGAGVIDPEAGRRNRANIDWGETPAQRPSDVATLTLSEDRRTVQITPGPEPTGTLYILGPSPSDSAKAHCKRSDSTLTATGKRGLCGRPVRVRAGPIILTKTAASTPSQPVDPAAIEALKTLGYVQ